MMSETNSKRIIEASDYGHAAWLIMVKKIPYHSWGKKNEGKMIYYFEMDETDWTALRVEYANSEFAAFDDKMRRLADPGYARKKAR